MLPAVEVITFGNQEREEKEGRQAERRRKKGKRYQGKIPKKRKEYVEVKGKVNEEERGWKRGWRGWGGARVRENNRESREREV